VEAKRREERARRRGREKGPPPDLLEREKALWGRGYQRVAGVDEVGRGPLAGPVVAAAVVLSPDVELPGVNDSKQVVAGRREELVERIRRQALAVEVGAASPREIDRIGIARATFAAMTRALQALDPPPDFVLVDGRRIPFVPWPQEARPRADGSSLSVAAASLVAKVSRDRVMDRLDERYPVFGFGRHKGYATAEHLEALRHHEPSPWHRRSFEWGVPGVLERRPTGTLRALGAEGEEIAARYLEGLGFRVVERNIRSAGVEVDLVAWDGEELVFVEVKLRRSLSHGDGESAVTPAKQRRLSRAALGYVSGRGLAAERLRFDVVAIQGSPRDPGQHRIHHVRNAFAGASGSLW
jgi:ribonuclease HII